MKTVDGNRLTLLKNGAALFPALEAAIELAQHRVHLESYIVADDACARRVVQALIGAAQRGVNVRMLIDGFGSRETLRELVRRLDAGGVQLAVFRPERPGIHLHKNRLRRTHRKIALIDDRVAFVGGINIVDDFNDNFSQTHPRYDYAVQVEGPLLAEIETAVAKLWRASTWWRGRVKPLGQRPTEQISRPPPSIVGSVSAALVVRDNFRNRRAIEHEYATAIAAARSSIMIVSPYFLPARKLRHGLCDAAQRGVRVELLLQGVADHPLLLWATRALYGQLLGAGVTIHEYQAAILHGKVAVIDDHWATVGSSNLDPFSLLLNREANIVALDTEFAQTLYASIQAEISENARPLPLRDWQQRRWWTRVKSWLAYSAARAIAGLFGLRHD